MCIKRIENRVNKKRKASNNNVFLIIIVCFIISGIYLLVDKNIFSLSIGNISYKTMYLASFTNEVSVFTLEEKENDFEENNNDQKNKKVLVEVDSIPRGVSVEVTIDDMITYKDNHYCKIKINGTDYYILDSNLIENYEEVVLENKIYTRSATSILATDGSKKIIGLANKGDELKVVGYDKVNSNGEVETYTVKFGDQEGIVYGKYMSYTKEESLLNYMADTYDPIHSKIKNSYGGGEAIGLDFYPNEKIQFENNKMPDSVYALYLNCGKNTINNIDSYIEFAKSTNINAFVVDIKDNQSPAYPAEVFQKYSPTNYRYAINSYESYKNAITKLKEAGFYVIGRITVFKDSYYVKDNPSVAILNKDTNSPYLHNGSYWPSAYNRDVWYFNVALAKEAVEKFGFNEINFDYVRFPDRMNSVRDIVDLKNIYNESKVQAIQRFASYAKDVLHELNTYISVDVFGETTNGTYTTAYGQYWPAISNVVDVISGMPYPDHFAAGSYGIAKPWNEPYKLMNYWARYAMDRQKQIPTPAKVRTWIQAYDVLKYVDRNGIDYGAKQLEEQIRGLYDAGVTEGYITWLSNSKLEKYKEQVQAFKIDYRKEYGLKNG